MEQNLVNMKYPGLAILTIWTLVSCSSDNPTPTEPFVSDGAANAGPVISIEAVRYVIAGDDVTITATATDPDGTVTSRIWSQIEGESVALTDDGTGLGTFAAPAVTTISNLDFAFLATDDDGLEGGRVITVTVLPQDLLQARMGVLTGADVAAVRTTNPGEVIESTTTSKASDVTTGGTFSLRLNDIDDEEWVLVSVSGGTDIDVDNDGVVDAAPTDNNGTLRALARAADWRSPGLTVTPLSEISVQHLLSVSGSIETISPQSMEMRLSTIVWELLSADVSEDDTFDYLDITSYQPEDSGILNSETLSVADLESIAADLRSADAASAGAAISALLAFDSFAIVETNLGTFKVELFPNVVPDTAGNFMTLSRRGYYDDLIFHRIVEGFVMQGGDPFANGTGGASMVDDPFGDEFDASLSNVQYSLAMANSGPNTNKSQFFVNLADNTNLDFDKSPLTSAHSVFGQVVEGQSVIDEIGLVEVGANNLPVSSVRMQSVTITRK